MKTIEKDIFESTCIEFTLILEIQPYFVFEISNGLY